MKPILPTAKQILTTSYIGAIYTLHEECNLFLIFLTFKNVNTDD